MNSRIAQMTIVVGNQSEAVEFYTKTVGFKKKVDFPTPDGDRWIVVGPEDQEVGLALIEAGWAENSGLGREWKVGDGSPILLQVQDCKKSYLELKSKGVGFKRVWGEELKTQPYGTVAFFADPDGNLFEIMQPSQAVVESFKARLE